MFYINFGDNTSQNLDESTIYNYSI